MNLLSTFFSFTPGILQVFMGDEYFTELPFQKNPSALDIASALPGGSHNGIYNFTKSLLDFRLTKKVGILDRLLIISYMMFIIQVSILQPVHLMYLHSY